MKTSTKCFGFILQFRLGKENLDSIQFSEKLLAVLIYKRCSFTYNLHITPTAGWFVCARKVSVQWKASSSEILDVISSPSIIIWITSLKICIKDNNHICDSLVFQNFLNTVSFTVHAQHLVNRSSGWLADSPLCIGSLAAPLRCPAHL